MMFEGEKIFDASFDVYAGNYHSVRPGYPGQMYEDIKTACAIEENSELLEIGAGSGIATKELAKFGCNIVGIEPGTKLVDIAKKETANRKKVKIVKGTFEDFNSSLKFDSILALTAFHWIKGEEKYKKTYNLLKTDGNLVIVWNSFLQSDSPVVSKVNSAYQELLPDIYPLNNIDVNEAALMKLSKREKEIHESSLFYMYYLKKYLTVYNYDGNTYPKLLNTYPKIIKLEEERRKKFLEKVGTIVKKHKKISIPVLTTLIVCKKRDSFMKLIKRGVNND